MPAILCKESATFHWLPLCGKLYVATDNIPMQCSIQEEPKTHLETDIYIQVYEYIILDLFLYHITPITTYKRSEVRDLKKYFTYNHLCKLKYIGSSIERYERQ